MFSFPFVKPLDRDGGSPSRLLTVAATDGEYEATAQVLVNLRDVNDNAPAFSASRIVVSVPENSPAGW